MKYTSIKERWEGLIQQHKDRQFSIEEFIKKNNSPYARNSSIWKQKALTKILGEIIQDKAVIDWTEKENVELQFQYLT